jgi:hypothetical protein
MITLLESNKECALEENEGLKSSPVLEDTAEGNE